jgi:hypothetical protein
MLQRKRQILHMTPSHVLQPARTNIHVYVYFNSHRSGPIFLWTLLKTEPDHQEINQTSVNTWRCLTYNNQAF